MDNSSTSHLHLYVMCCYLSNL